MEKQNKYLSITEFCKKNGLAAYRFFEILNRYPKLAGKMKTNVHGEKVLDKKSITEIRSILRKEKSRETSASSAAKEINLLTAQIDELRRKVFRLRAENVRLRKALNSNIRKTKNGKN